MVGNCKSLKSHPARPEFPEIAVPVPRPAPGLNIRPSVPKNRSVRDWRSGGNSTTSISRAWISPPAAGISDWNSRVWTSLKAHLRIARDAVGLHSVAKVSVPIERPGNLETCSGSAMPASDTYGYNQFSHCGLSLKASRVPPWVLAVFCSLLRLLVHRSLTPS